MTLFWDTSAIVRICVPGQASSYARKLARETSSVCWWCAPVEVRGVLERLKSNGEMNPVAYTASRERLERMLAAWREVEPSETVRQLAYMQLERFLLKAADALHLAAALVWCKEHPRGRSFVSSDQKLTAAARDAGFTTIEV